MRNNKVEMPITRGGQLRSFRKSSKQAAATVEDFLGIVSTTQEVLVNGIPGWENPLEPTSEREQSSFVPQTPSRTLLRRLETHKSGPMLRATVSSDSNSQVPTRSPRRLKTGGFDSFLPPKVQDRCSDETGCSPNRQLHTRKSDTKSPFKPPEPLLRPSQSIDTNCNVEHDFKRSSSNGYNAGISIHDIAVDPFDCRSARSACHMPHQPRRVSEHSPPIYPVINPSFTVERVSKNKDRPMGFPPRRTTSYSGPSPVYPRTRIQLMHEEQEEERIKIALERSLYETSPNHNEDILASNSSNEAGPMEKNFNSVPSIQSPGIDSPKGLIKEPVHDDDDDDFIWCRDSQRWLKIHIDDIEKMDCICEESTDNGHKNDPRLLTRTMNLTSEAVKQRLRDLEEEKSILENAMLQSSNTVVSNDSSNCDVTIEEAQEEELLAMALHRSRYDM